jgi:hypothetical protein
MMSTPDFAAGLAKLKPAQAELPAVPPAPRPARETAPSRVGKVAIGAHFDLAVRQQLAIMAARQNKSQAALLAEALNLLFAEYGESQIAKA